MMIAGGTDVRTVASYLGHSNVAMTLNTYAEVDPDAKRTAVEAIQDSFDIEESPSLPKFEQTEQPEHPAITFLFTIEQLEAMLAQAKGTEEKR